MVMHQHLDQDLSPQKVVEVVVDTEEVVVLHIKILVEPSSDPNGGSGGGGTNGGPTTGGSGGTYGNDGGGGATSNNYGGGGGGGAGGAGQTGTTTQGGHGGLGVQAPATFNDPTNPYGALGPSPGRFWFAGGGGAKGYPAKGTGGAGPGGGGPTLVVVMENLDLRHHPDLEIMEPLTQVVEEEDLELLLAVMVDQVLLWLHIPLSIDNKISGTHPSGLHLTGFIICA